MLEEPHSGAVLGVAACLLLENRAMNTAPAVPSHALSALFMHLSKVKLFYFVYIEEAVKQLSAVTFRDL